MSARWYAYIIGAAVLTLALVCATIARAQIANPPPKVLAVLVVAFIGPDSDAKPRHFSESVADWDECLREGARIRAMWQGNGRIGDLITTCVQFNLSPRDREHS